MSYDRRMIVNHESAHALFAFLMGFRILRVSCEFDTDCLGPTEHYTPPGDARSVEDMARARAAVSLAPQALRFYGAASEVEPDVRSAKAAAYAAAPEDAAMWLDARRTDVLHLWRTHPRVQTAFTGFTFLLAERQTIEGPEAEAYFEVYL